MADLDALMASVKDKFNEIIQKPKMSEKLLSKPPFRFLHDTISAVTQATGFASGLYSDAELDSNTIADKQQKVDYLQKIINMVGICKGFPLQVNPLKIVAGQEPENTNQFLLFLSECATDSNLDQADAVRRVLNGESPSEGAPIPRKAAPSRGPPPREAAAEAKASARQDDSGDSKSGGAGAKPDADVLAQQPERGKSRGGTRGTNPSRSTQDMGLSRSADIRNPNLDSEIEKCDGSEAKTQLLLGELIQKPKLSDKLLQKPPFRFLFDIIMEVIRVTNFGQHLYSAEEMDVNNINDKEKKMLFLDKAIKLIGNCLNTLVEAKSAKIIAGADAQSTNNMLQLLALAAKNVPDSNRQVKAVIEELGGGNPAGLTSGGGSSSSSSSSSSKSDSPARGGSDMSSAEPKQTEAIRSSDKANVVESSKSEVDTSLAAPRREITRQDDDSKGGQQTGSQGDDAGDGENRRNARPTTARRRPPKVKEEDAAGAKDVPAAKKAEGIMVDGQVDDDDEVVEEERRLADDVKSRGTLDNQSKLVQDIISRQVEQDASKMTDSSNNDESKGAGDENQGGIRFKKKVSSDKKIPQAGGTAANANLSSTVKAKYSSAEIDRIRNSIQILVKNTGPLGSCMDFIQEDVGLMTSELHKWEEECRTYDLILDQERKKTQEILMPLQQELSDVEEQITDQLMKISSIKASITKNDDTIQKALNLISTA